MKPASAWRRLMGVCYECVLLFGVVWLTGYAFSALVQFRGQPGAARTAFQIYMALVLGAYFVWLWSDGRRSLPMKTLAMRLVTDAGAPLSKARAALRFLAAGAMLILPMAAARDVHPALALLALLPFAWMPFDARRRTLWDLAAGTRMVTDG